MKRIFLCLFYGLLILSVKAQGEDKEEVISIGTKHSMRSEILDEDRPLLDFIT